MSIRLPSAPLARPAALGWVLLASLLALLTVTPVAAAPQDDVRELDSYVDRALVAVQSGDLAAARAAYGQYETRWFEVEDGVKAQSRQAYRAIEDAMSDVKIAFSTEPVDLAKVSAALLELDRRGHQFQLGQEVGTEPAASSAAAPGDNQARLVTLVGYLERADAAITANKPAEAATELRGFQQAWPEVEGLVHAKSPTVYANTENALAEAYARLVSTPPDLARAHELVSSMRTQLAPFTQAAVGYGMFDAAVIMLREGLEALLVVAALLGFLKKAGRTDQQRWIWGGSFAGVALSILVAFGAQAAFSRAGAAIGSEMIEGVVGLTAAVMLFYVSYWLHQKSRLGAWQKYIHDKSTAALARNSVLSLATIAFLAVFREGAETVLFYLGIAPSISTADLLGGIGIGVGLLVVIGVALLTLGLRLPLRPFFLGSSLLIYYLGFKFVGTGIHALQVAGVLPATPAPFPSNELLGLFPTWQTALPQLALLIVAVAVTVYSLRRRPTQTPVAA